MTLDEEMKVGGARQMLGSAPQMEAPRGYNYGIVQTYGNFSTHFLNA